MTTISIVPGQIIKVANSKFRAKDYSGALKIYKSLIESGNFGRLNRSEVFVRAGTAYLYLHHYPQAALLANKALNADLNNPHAYALKGMVYHAAFGKKLVTNPNVQEIISNYVFSNGIVEAIQKAIKLFQKDSGKNKLELHQMHTVLGNVYAQIGHRPKATAQHELAAKYK